VNIKTTGGILIAALAAAVVVSLILFRSVAIEAAYPVERCKTVLCKGLRTRVGAWFRAQSVAGENVRLKREVASLALAIGDVERLETENARLRRALDYEAKMSERWIPAEVLSSGGASVGSRATVRVGKGTMDGIRKGAVVVVPEGLVGKVSAATPHTAEITLVTDPSVQVACEVESACVPKVLGVLAGCRGDSLVLRHLRNAVDVPPRSRVLTSGLGGIFPKGLEIGTLQLLRKDKNSLAVEGEVMPSVDFALLEDVFIRREK